MPEDTETFRLILMWMECTAQKPCDVTGDELSVPQVPKDHHRAMIRGITDAIGPEGGELNYVTVKKLLARLDDEVLIARDTSRMTREFTLAI